MGKKHVKFMCTAFRDGFQSVYGARVYTKDFMPAVAAARDAGITWFEAGGGARFQSLYFYCNEDAFEMMDLFRKTAGPDADLQTLARGTNVVGLESQSSDVIRLHAQLFKKHGISSIRNFDALNDVNNLIHSGKCIVEAGAKHQVCVTMMQLPPGCEGAHDTPFYLDCLKRILQADIPFDSVCFKDASGTAVPNTVYETIKGARKMLPPETHLHFHSHETAGICILGYKAALDAGADGIDLSLAPVSGGTCQSDVLTMWHALRGTDFDLGIDPEKVRQAEEVFKDCMKDYPSNPEAIAVEPLIPWSPMPGGALTANTEMLRDNGIMDRFPEILHAMSEVVRKGGFGTSVTPVSQFYFQQAFNNVMFGPWAKIVEGYGLMVLGYFGRTPCDPDPDVVKLAAQQLGREPTKKTPLEINDADPSKGLAVARKMLQAASLPETDENLFIAATCKEKGIAFLKGEAKPNVRKLTKKDKAPKAAEAPSDGGYTVTVNGKVYEVCIEGSAATVNGKSYTVDVKEGISGGTCVPGGKERASTADAQEIKAPMPGSVFKLIAQVGNTVKAGDDILILEAMKMEVPVKSPVDGTVTALAVAQGDQVTANQTLAYIN